MWKVETISKKTCNAMSDRDQHSGSVQPEIIKRKESIPVLALRREASSPREVW